MGSHNNMDRSLQGPYIVSREQSIKWRKEKHDSINQTWHLAENIANEVALGISTPPCCLCGQRKSHRASHQSGGPPSRKKKEILVRVTLSPLADTTS